MILMDPRTSRARWALPLLRVVAGQRVVIALAGSKWFYFGSHWCDKMLLCSGDGCPGCLQGAPRMMGYRACRVFTGHGWSPALLEASCGAIAGLQGFQVMEGVDGEAAKCICVTRRHRRSPLRLEPEDGVSMPDAVSLPDHVTLNAVAVLYGLPTMQAGEESSQWAVRVQPVARGFLAAVCRRQA